VRGGGFCALRARTGHRSVRDRRTRLPNDHVVAAGGVAADPAAAHKPGMLIDQFRACDARIGVVGLVYRNASSQSPRTPGKNTSSGRFHTASVGNASSPSRRKGRSRHQTRPVSARDRTAYSRTARFLPPRRFRDVDANGLVDNRCPDPRLPANSQRKVVARAQPAALQYATHDLSRGSGMGGRLEDDEVAGAQMRANRIGRAYVRRH
jgi:hypothetical protein